MNTIKAQRIYFYDVILKTNISFILGLRRKKSDKTPTTFGFFNFSDILTL